MKKSTQTRLVILIIVALAGGTIWALCDTTHGGISLPMVESRIHVSASGERTITIAPSILLLLMCFVLVLLWAAKVLDWKLYTKEKSEF